MSDMMQYTEAILLKGWVNNLLGQTFTAFGAYAPNWKFTHNQCHHTYPSIPGADGDYTPSTNFKVS